MRKSQLQRFGIRHVWKMRQPCSPALLSSPHFHADARVLPPSLIRMSGYHLRPVFSISLSPVSFSGLSRSVTARLCVRGRMVQAAGEEGDEREAAFSDVCSLWKAAPGCWALLPLTTSCRLCRCCCLRCKGRKGGGLWPICVHTHQPEGGMNNRQFALKKKKRSYIFSDIFSDNAFNGFLSWSDNICLPGFSV